MPAFRGLCAQLKVAPYAGAWIEIHYTHCVVVRSVVAPYAGAWIEMINVDLPFFPVPVAPYAGAWIEIKTIS